MKSVSQLVSLSFSQSVSQSVYHSGNKSVSQSVNLSVNHLVSQSDKKNITLKSSLFYSLQTFQIFSSSEAGNCNEVSQSVS